MTTTNGFVVCFGHGVFGEVCLSFVLVIERWSFSPKPIENWSYVDQAFPLFGRNLTSTQLSK